MMIRVVIKETTLYVREFEREELIGLLVKQGYIREDELDMLTDAELAAFVEDEHPGEVEESMQRYGDVDSAEWTARNYE